MRRVLAALVALALAHGTWASARTPCASGTAAPGASSGAAAGAERSAPPRPAAHAHHGTGVADSDAAEPAERPADAAPDAACPMTMWCAPMLAAVPRTLRPTDRPVPSAPPVLRSMWRDGVVRAIDPPPPRHG